MNMRNIRRIKRSRESELDHLLTTKSFCKVQYDYALANCMLQSTYYHALPQMYYSRISLGIL